MRNFFGRDDFTWFVGVVEDRHDPVKMGRVRVRAFGWHTEDKDKIPTEELPWALPMNPINSASVSGIGQTPLGLVEGSWVVGFFMDGERAQEPVIMGSFASAPSNMADGSLGFNDPNGKYPLYVDEVDVNKLARGENTKTHTPDTEIPEPQSPYNAEYPYNHVYETESGHVKEFDDTEGAERIREWHKSGTFYEVHPEGDIVTHIVRDGYRVVHGNDYVHVKGNVKIIIDETCDMHIKKDWNIQVDGDMDLDVQGTITQDSVEGNFYLNQDRGNAWAAARKGDTADTGDGGTGSHFDVNSAGTDKIETGSSSVFIGK